MMKRFTSQGIQQVWCGKKISGFSPTLSLSLSLYLSLCLSLRGKELDKEKEKAVKSGGHCVHTSFFLWAFFCQVWSHRFSLVLLFALLFSGFAFAVAFSQLLRILFSKTRRRGRRGGGGGEGNNTISCRHITMRLSSCFLPCEKGVAPVYHARNTFLLALVSQQTSNFAQKYMCGKASLSVEV
jgi:hypothetical protein